jgi:hypothetical protein
VEALLVIPAPAAPSYASLDNSVNLHDLIETFRTHSVPFMPCLSPKLFVATPWPAATCISAINQPHQISHPNPKSLPTSNPHGLHQIPQRQQESRLPRPSLSEMTANKMIRSRARGWQLMQGCTTWSSTAGSI